MDSPQINGSRFVSPGWIGFVASGLMLGHAAISFYWAAGGTIGLSLLSEGIEEMARERHSGMIAIVWTAALIKTVIGALPLMIALDWRPPVGRWLVAGVLWATGLGLTGYGFLMAISLAATGPLLAGGDAEQGYWAYLLLWSPLWIAIGVSYSFFALRFARSEP